MATQVYLLQNNLTQMDRALQTIKKRVATTRQDSIVDEFVEIDSDQWSDQENHRQIEELKGF